MALFTITTNAYVNLPPSQVGDNSASTNYGITKTFSSADFTTGTTPAYSDPEGDSAHQLKIVTRPATGTLEINSVPIVTDNYVVDFADIAAGLFTYVPDNGTLTTYADPFTFEIADIGSGTFVG